ncbi:hypothetical protein ACOMHN_060802 [Nucella lapillus]
MTSSALLFCSLLSAATSFATSFATSPPTSPLTSPTPPRDFPGYLPAEWSTFCDARYDVDDDVNVTVTCHVTPEVPVLWQLSDLRDSLNETFVDSTNLKLSVKLDCSAGGGGMASLPFPFRAPGLVKLTARRCLLLDKWGDFNTSWGALPRDWLSVQDLQHCVWLNDPHRLEQLLRHVESISSRYDCGQDRTLVTIVDRNNTDARLPDTGAPDPCESVPEAFRAVNLTYPWDIGTLLESVEIFEQFWNYSKELGGLAEECAVSLEPLRTVNVISGRSKTVTPQAGSASTRSTTEDPNIDIVDTFIILRRYNTKCRYERLEVLDESQTPILNSKHFEYLVQNTQFPRLHTLNYSHTPLPTVPKQLREWRRYFDGSKLQVMDLSHCAIEEVGDIPPDVNLHGVSTRLDLRFNRLTKLTLSMLQAWALVPDFRVDVRNNPIHCSCDIRDFVTQVNNDIWASAPGRKFYQRMMSEVTCHTPPKLKGRALTSLTWRDLDCPVVVGPKAAELRAGLAVLGVVVVVLLVLLALAVHYRREVRILMYTRVNILLPCGLPPSARRPEKTYDAFVAYAHQDSDWVLGSLMKRLEGAEGSPKGRKPCRLCLHQRDFVVGKPIVDNIVDSIAASRHTIIVLTNNFVRSGWAMEELQQAYHQSLEERSRHLVVVLLEPVDQAQMSPTLRRCCKTFTYLHVSDSFFWDRLLFSIQIGGPRHDPGTDKSSKPPTARDSSSDLTMAPKGGHTSPDPHGWGGWGEEGGEGEEREEGEGEFDKHTMFSEALRTVSVDSAYSTISTDTQDVTITWDTA